MSVKTSVSGFQRMTEPVRLPLNGSFCRPRRSRPFEVEVIVEAVAVDVGGHPLTGILGGAQAQTVQAQAEIIVAVALGVFAAGVQLAKTRSQFQRSSALL